MGTNPRHGIGLRFAFLAFLIWLAWPGNTRLHAQETYTSSPGQTSIYSFYDPNLRQRRRRLSPPALRHSRSRFCRPSRWTSISPKKRRSPSTRSRVFYSLFNWRSPRKGRRPALLRLPGPIVSTPLYSWQGLTDTGQEPASPDIAVGPSDVLMVVNASIGQFTKSGTLIKLNSLQDWFSDVLSATCPSNCFVYDPWIVYDRTARPFRAPGERRAFYRAGPHLLLSPDLGLERRHLCRRLEELGDERFIRRQRLYAELGRFLAAGFR